MITARIKIGSGNAVDTQTYGLVYLSSDNIIGAPTKGFESTSYPEQDGENVNPKTVDDAFDYTVKFFIKTTSLTNANSVIKTFNDMLYTQNQGSYVKEFKRVYFYNDYKKVLIVGYPSPISEATDFWRDSAGNLHDVVVVEFKIRVDQPHLCNFNLTTT